MNLKRYSLVVLTDPVIRHLSVCNGIPSPTLHMQHNRHRQCSAYLGRQSNRLQVRSVTAWAYFLGELVMGTVLAVSTNLSHLISVPDACRVAENGAACKV